MAKVLVDTTVIEKAIACPTGSKLCLKSLQRIQGQIEASREIMAALQPARIQELSFDHTAEMRV